MIVAEIICAEEFFARHELDRVELQKGTVVELPMSDFRHGKTCSMISYQIGDYLQTREIGRGFSNNSFILTTRNPDSVRGPDVMFMSYERLPKGPIPHGLLDVSPELVIEVRSPEERLSALNWKALEYLAAGVRAVVLLDPERAAATVFREEELPQTFHNGDSLTVPEILPGFEVKLAKLFS